MKKYIILLFLTSISLSLNAADPALRWAGDRLVYGGEVYASAWTGLDEDVIDVDYFAGDTLRAVVVGVDSSLRVFRSNDNGQNWSEVVLLHFANGEVTEPYIVHGPDSTYHVFGRLLGNDRIYTRAYRTANDAWISGTNLYVSALNDTVNNYTVCTDRIDNPDYNVYVVYSEGSGTIAGLQFTTTTDMGQNWSTPSQITQNRVINPDLAYGRNDTLYLAYTYTTVSGDTSSIRVRRSYNGGSTWFTYTPIETDTMLKNRAKIAAALDGSGYVWVIWPKLIAGGWDLRWAWSQNVGAGFSAPATVNSDVDSSETMPSIAVHDPVGSTENTPYVTFLRGNQDLSGGINVRNFYWSGGTWTIDSTYSDNPAFLARPIQTFTSAGTPAFAYVGENATNVYFDSWALSGIEEDSEVSDEKIECSLDRNIILGTASLSYTLTTATNVEVSLINILGQKITTLDSGDKDSGEHTVSVSAENLSQGIYYIVIEGENGQKGIVKATVLK